MSTNIEESGLPDGEALAQLANQLFKALPGSTIPGLGGAPLQDLPVDYPQADFKQPDFSQAGPAYPAAKSDGAGHSIQTPVSVAGSGKSPSAIENDHAFNLSDPQTSLPDPHFEDGKVPSSVAGSGRSPSLQNGSVQPNTFARQDTATQSHKIGQLPYGTGQLPYANDYPRDSGLAEALTSISSFISKPQLPMTGANEAPYYFLNEANPLRGQRELSQVAAASLTGQPFDVELVKKDFPILKELVNGRPLVWLDNAATTQKPQSVIDRISDFYTHENSNIHRAAHELAARATDAYEGARKKVQHFLNAGSVNEIVFVRGATEAINLVAKSWGEQHISAGDEIILSHLEHHANIVPWQQLADKKGARIKVIPVDDDGQVLLEEYSKLLSNKTRLVSFTQVSNALGTITPAKEIVAMAHQVGAKVLVDGAQSVSHMRVDVRDLDADWFAFSGHKVFAPTGIGVLYRKEYILNETQPWQGGGNMIKDVTFEHTQYQNAPGRFEAGTGNIADAVGLGAAIDYVSKLGMDLIDQYEHQLLVYATKLLKDVPGLRLIGTAPRKASVLSFVLDGFTNDQVGQALNRDGIAVRTGHHCAQPILRRFGVESTVRPSLAFYNTCADVHALVSVLQRLRSGRR
jgi:cysteine desulfurase / selenocysteine lyase